MALPATSHPSIRSPLHGGRPASLGEGAALLVIDVQRGFDAPGWGRRNNPDMEARWPGQPGNEPKDAAAPRAGELVFEKRAHACFIGTSLHGEFAEVVDTRDVLDALQAAPRPAVRSA